MPTGPGTKPAWQNSLSDAAARIEAELKDLVRVVDDEVVPEARKHGAKALKTLAAKVQKLAEHMDDAGPKGKQ